MHFFLLLFSLIAQAEDPRIMIGVLDTGIVRDAYIKPFLCAGSHYDATGEGLRDDVGHGTDMAYLISRNLNPETHCLIIIKYCHNRNESNKNGFQRALHYASQIPLKFLNISAGGDAPDFIEQAWLKHLIIKRGVKVVVAAGNDGAFMSLGDNAYDRCQYPACYPLGPNLYVVGALTEDGTKRTRLSNYGPIVRYWEQGEKVKAKAMTSGTSAATALFMGKLVAGVYK